MAGNQPSEHSLARIVTHLSGASNRPKPTEVRSLTKELCHALQKQPEDLTDYEVWLAQNYIARELRNSEFFNPREFHQAMASSSSNVVGVHYRVGKKIGEGSFGVIFEGTNLLNNSQVAIKFV